MDSHPPGAGENQKPFKIVPSLFETSHPTTELILPTNRTALQCNVKPLFRISTTYGGLPKSV